MGAVRIYKAPVVDQEDGITYFWQARSNGCLGADAEDCNFGSDHEGYCNGYKSYAAALLDLNNSSYFALGGYLEK